MKKKVISLFVCGIMAAALFAGCGKKAESAAAGSTPSESNKTESASTGSGGEETTVKTESTGNKGKIGVILRAAGNPYCAVAGDGFVAACEAAGYECVCVYPEEATADAQIPLIQSMISQGVSAIGICGNDANALSASLQQAIGEDIKIVAFDATVGVEDRNTFVNQAGTMEIGQTLMDAVYDLCDGEGQYAILSATSQATNQNAWIAAMAEVAEGDKYAGLELAEVAYGDDEPQKSTDQTQALLQKYPDLKVICAPTTVGINAAAKVVQDQNSSVLVTGLGLPSEMAEYIGDEKACPYMYLWNPRDLGALAAYTCIACVEGTITGAVGETFEVPEMSDTPYEIVAASDGGTEVILGPPFCFNPENIDEWKEVY